MLNRALLADMIGDAYRIIEAEDGKQAVAALQKEGAGISLVLLDYVMPQMNGFDVLEVMNKNGWIKDIPVIMVSAESDAAYIERAYELGVTDFINRPYDVNIVRRRVMNTLMLYQKQRTLMGMVADQVYEREKSNNLMVYILSHIVEFRNGESGMHVLNVQAMTEMILTQLMRLTDQYPLTTEDISLITMASSLHDIGKIAIPEEILNKVMENVYTNLDVTEMASILSDVANYQIVAQDGVPFEDSRTTGTIGKKGSCVIPLDLETNVVKLHELLFDVTEYEPSDQVKQYSQKVQADTSQYMKK